MAEQNGKLVTCDRCDKMIFLKSTGEGERDGGFTRWNIFEPFPVGWEYHREVGMICPECNSTYKLMVNNFMSEVRGNGGKQD